MPRASDARARGESIERLAGEWLQARGLTLVARNQHAKGGEIDLVMRDGDTLVFVEVRHRADSRHGHPLETITLAKQRRLIRAARFYLLHNGLSCGCRFDAVGVTGAPPDLEYTWVRAAFDAF
ncbi:MAG: YraN family protein [Halomonas sp.]|nr:YraN family protein [Halomonas sp.]